MTDDLQSLNDIATDAQAPSTDFFKLPIHQQIIRGPRYFKVFNALKAEFVEVQERIARVRRHKDNPPDQE